jgi:hypothetical protein
MLTSQSHQPPVTSEYLVIHKICFPLPGSMRLLDEINHFRVLHVLPDTSFLRGATLTLGMSRRLITQGQRNMGCRYAPFRSFTSPAPVVGVGSGGGWSRWCGMAEEADRFVREAVRA